MSRMLLIVGALLVAVAAVPAATPPPQVNYQGVLRDNTPGNEDAPLDGTFDMVFRFYDDDDPSLPENEILVDSHEALGSGPVTVQGGLFNVLLGGGAVGDGAGPGTYADLGEVFRDFTPVYLEIEVDGETLSPRVQIVSAGYALNADNLDGLDGGSLLRSDASDVFTLGTLTLNPGTTLDVKGSAAFNADLRVDGDGPDGDQRVFFYNNDSPTGEQFRWRDANDGFEMTDSLGITGPLFVAGLFDSNVVGYSRFGAGNDDPDTSLIGENNDVYIEDFLEIDGLTLFLNGEIQMDNDGPEHDQTIYFWDGGAPVGQWFRWSDAEHRFAMSGELAIVDRIDFGPGADDDLGFADVTTLTGGGDADGLHTHLLDGHDSSYFLDTSATSQTKEGDLTVKNLVVSGVNLDFGWGGAVQGGSAGLTLRAGDADDDDLILDAGDGLFAGATADGRIEIQGLGPIRFRAGDSTYQFLRKDGPVLVDISATGDLDAANLIAGQGRVYFFDTSNSRIEANVGGLFLEAGNELDDDIFLNAGSPGSADGLISVLGGGSIRIEPFDGQINFAQTGSGIGITFDAGTGSADFDGGIEAAGSSRIGTATYGSAHRLTVETLSSDDALRLIGPGASFGWNARLNFGDSDFVYLGEPSDDHLEIHGSNRTNVTGGNVGIGSGLFTPAARLDVQGDFQASGTKNFLQNHPYRDDLSVVYTALEGDEAATYTRGSARLTDGVAHVALGETFSLVTNPDLGLTAHVTPRGEWADLWVESITTGELVVRGASGPADAAFDYVVYGLRIGFEEQPVIRERVREATIPAHGYYDEDYAEMPDLYAASAWDRFVRIETDVRGTALSLEASAAEELRLAIGVHERAAELVAKDPASAGTETPGLEEAAPGLVEVDPTVPEAHGSESSTVAISAGPLPEADHDVYARSFRPSAADLATLVAVAEPVEAGDVLAIDPDRAVVARLARVEADTGVIGVVAASPGLVLGSRPDERSVGEQRDESSSGTNVGDTVGQPVPVSLSGVVFCKVDAGFGAIRPGDLLTTSPTPGHAMHAYEPLPGTILGKALEPLDGGTGRIRVLVTLR